MADREKSISHFNEREVITMKTLLLTANVGELLKVCVQNTRDVPKGCTPSIYEGFPKEAEYMTPVGKCTIYKFNEMRMYVTDKLLVEVANDEILAEMNFIFDPETEEFKYAAYIAMSFIVGYIIGNSDVLYKSFIESYLEKILFNKYGTSINVAAYNVFIQVEEKIVNVKDHIPLQDIIFQRGMSTYFVKPAPLDITAIDITNCTNLFKAKNIFCI